LRDGFVRIGKEKQERIKQKAKIEYSNLENTKKVIKNKTKIKNYKKFQKFLKKYVKIFIVHILNF